MPMHRTLNQDFFKTWSPEMAYVLGFFTADGNMCKHRNGGHYLEFTSADLEILEKIKRIMSLHQGISIVRRNSKEYYRIQIGSRALFNDLINLGLTPAKSKTIRFPEVPGGYIRHFVMGYFDGDGCAHIGKHWAKDRNKKRWVFNMRFTSGSQDFLRGLWKTLKSQNIEGGYLYNKNGRGYELVFSWLKGLDLCRFMYDNVQSGMYLGRKYGVYNKALAVIYKGA